MLLNGIRPAYMKLQQQVLGRVYKVFFKMLHFMGIEANENQMHLYKSYGQWFRTYDDRGRLPGENVPEPDRSTWKIAKPELWQVLTTAETAALLFPHVEPLPDFYGYKPGKEKELA